MRKALQVLGWSGTIRVLAVLLTVHLLLPAAHAQTYDTLRVMTYNVLNYPGATSTVRNPAFRDVLDYVNPDILVVQEMTSSAGVTEFLNSVLNVTQPGEYAAAPFLNGPDTDNTCFYKASRVSFVSQTVLSTELRDINGYRLRPVGVSADSLDLQIYSAHLKSSQGFESERFGEADTLRNHLNSLPGGGWLMAVGDFNLYTSTEPAYGELTGSQVDNSGRLYDPLNPSLVTQDWNDNATYRFIHTQSTRVNPPAPDDGGALGGMDDRFDFMLPSLNFQGAAGWQYISGSYTALGQDGAHLNASVNDPPLNSVVPDSIADALYRNSDHLPVYVVIRRQTTVPASLGVISPNGGETWYVGESSSIQWTSSGLTGNVTLKINRTYPAGSFTTLIAGTPNDGLYSWLVSPPLTATARIQVVSDVQPAVNDFSDGNFTIANPTIVLSSPNGGEVWEVGSSHAILWNGTGFIGNVNIELTRSWPVPSWETITANSANDGADAWAVSGPVSSSARVRVLSIGNALAGDTSAANFTVAAQSLTVVAPNGGESWTIGSPRVITWSSLGLSGNVRIDLNRIYPADAWETLFAMVPLANGAVNWAVTLPASGVARVRITSLADTSKQDISDANFTILQAPAPPTIRHDAHMDSAPGLVLFTAIVTDDAAGVTATLFHRAVGVSEFDSVALSPSGFPNEYFTSVAKSFGRCEYFVRATDVEGQPTETPIYGFMVGEPCGNQIIYDDGSAESYQWTLQDSLQWAVKFSPPVLPFAVSEAMIGVASYHPDSAHQQLRVRVFLADGPGGSPGTLVREVVRGSIGNIVGGVGAPGLKFARIMCYDELNDPYVASGDIFLSVANVLDGREAFALDTTPPHSGRSYVFDPCGEAWISEQVTDEVTRNGDRIVRMRGWGLAPPVLVVGRSGADIRLDWTRTGAPYYRVYSSTVANGVFSQFEGTAADTLFLDEGAVAMDLRLFYHVVSASQP